MWFGWMCMFIKLYGWCCLGLGGLLILKDIYVDVILNFLFYLIYIFFYLLFMDFIGIFEY